METETQQQQAKSYAEMNTEERAAHDAAFERWVRECPSPEEAATQARIDDLDNIHDELRQQVAELTELNSEDVPALRKAVWEQMHANRDERATIAVKNIDAFAKRVMETPREQQRKSA